jgi:hypothetical protein
VSDHESADEALRRAFQASSETSSGECSTEDVDRIWRAVAGELPAAERHNLIERLATDPALAEVWRMAHELQKSTQFAGLSATTPARRAIVWTRSWLAAAAVLLMAGAGVVVFQRSRIEVNDTFRASNHYVVESTMPADAALPRDSFRLRWTTGPAGSRYQVTATTEDLRVLTTASDLTTPELVIERNVLSEIPPGARVLWRVDVTLPGGERVSSATFTTRVQ